MGTEILIIIAYFAGMCVPVATVAVFLRMDADPEKAKHLPTADSYYMPGEGELHRIESDGGERKSLGCDGSVERD